MARRRKIGLIYKFDENWIGGTYYLLNLVSALNTLPDHQKPQLTIFYLKPGDKISIQQTGYPYLRFVDINQPLPVFKLGMNKISRTLFKGKQVYAWKHAANVVDTLFPNPPFGLFDNIEDVVYWIPDLQDRVLPELFEQWDLEERDEFYKKIAFTGRKVVFSSKTALNHFNQFYPGATVEKSVVNFAVTHPAYEHLDVKALRQEYQLPDVYFISPNQFWKHKNHRVVIEAVKLLKDRGVDCCVAFTGKENDYRNPDYTNQLKAYVQELGLEQEIRFLGFIDRLHQLQLMKHARAVIQPSLFEGWSTVVEDAKAMDQFVIASGIAVHREQLQQNALFFNPVNSKELAEIMEKQIQYPATISSNKYHISIEGFARAFLSVSLRNATEATIDVRFRS